MQTCDHCGVYFEPVSNSAGKFCTQSCYKMSRTKKVSKVCVVCKIDFEVPKRRDKTAKYCSNKCKATIAGDKHHLWKGGTLAGWYRREYGISLEQYDQMYDDQGGQCAICGTSTPGGARNRFHLDHCHLTGEIRGLLCHKCNNGLGYFNDDPSMLLEAFRYLHEYQ